ncbi:hypothetical protein SAMN05421663_10494 [Terribacillus halophilus]|uniref:Uncharacterized protein n=1 Tax=Terribacillus halophilus TaxID=361279 RepID=A0A1G6PDD6_9BACI|nr:hypothetical protein SAMN05421663_10494 [Terribacillus halophilus]
MEWVQAAPDYFLGNCPCLSEANSYPFICIRPAVCVPAVDDWCARIIWYAGHLIVVFIDLFYYNKYEEIRRCHLALCYNQPAILAITPC